MDRLHRQLAPISDAGWAAIDAEASRTLNHFLVGRDLIDFAGPKGWTHSAESTGRVQPLEPDLMPGVKASQRQVRPLIQLRSELEVSRAELESIDRGNVAPDLTPVTDAAKAAGLAEDPAIFHGYPAGGIIGLADGSPHEPVAIGADYSAYPSSVARAVSTLKTSGVGGPYSIALGNRCYVGVVSTEHGGYPVFEHLRHILGGRVLWAPAVNGAVVVSTRGDDFVIECGQDFSLGYVDHDATSVRLYLEESFTLTVKDEAAAVALVYDS